MRLDSSTKRLRKSGRQDRHGIRRIGPFESLLRFGCATPPDKDAPDYAEIQRRVITRVYKTRRAA